MTGTLAYLDAGTGSMIVGAVAAAGASVAVAAKAGWHRVLRKGKGSEVTPEAQTSGAQTSGTQTSGAQTPEGPSAAATTETVEASTSTDS